MTYIGKPIPRDDALEKSLGITKFMCDRYRENALIAGLFRSPHPHAKILKIETSKAKALKGVHAVLTFQDIPKLNRFGIMIQDQPVFCEDKVRFIGDTIAAVAAETKEILEEALSLIEVQYELLPCVSSPEEAMSSSILVHEKPAWPFSKGNIFWTQTIENGDLEKNFSDADLILEDTFITPRQMPSFLETENALAFLDENNELFIHSGGQHPHREKKQILRVIDHPEEKVHVINYPVGGAFGGKEEMTVQIPIALLALYTKKPVKISLSREESLIASWKRHPMKIRLKVGAKKTGEILAAHTSIIADTGAYASVGLGVLSLGMEASLGPYKIPASKVEGYCVYTNNGISGAMRGFGVPQVAFAFESMIDRLASKLNLDPLAIRSINVADKGDQSPLGYTFGQGTGAKKILEKISSLSLWEERKSWNDSSPHSWIKRGTGLALSFQPIGYGKNIPDIGQAKIIKRPDESYDVYVGSPDLGQGNATAYKQIAAESLGHDIKKVRVTVGNTQITPDSGAASSSRSVYAPGNAIILAAKKLLKKNLNEVTIGFQIPDEESKLPLYCIPHFVFTSMANIAQVEVNTLTGEIFVHKIVHIPNAGKIINPLGFEGQLEGGALMGMGFALNEHVQMKECVPQNKNFSQYILFTAHDMPILENYPVEEPEGSGPFGHKGVGEASLIAVAPAITNAVTNAVEVKINELPLTSEKLFFLMQKKD